MKVQPLKYTIVHNITYRCNIKTVSSEFQKMFVLVLSDLLPLQFDYHKLIFDDVGCRCDAATSVYSGKQFTASLIPKQSKQQAHQMPHLTIGLALLSRSCASGSHTKAFHSLYLSQTFFQITRICRREPFIHVALVNT